MHSPREAIKREIQRNLSPGRLFNGTKPRLRQIAERNTRSWNGRHRGRGGHGKSQEAFVIDPRKTQAESAEIIGQKDRAAHFRIDRLAKAVRKRKTKGQRRKLI